MKSLAVIGTAAMFLVGGGILVHGIPGTHDGVHAVAHAAETLPVIGGVLAVLVPFLIDALAGIAAGALILGGLTVLSRIRRD
jgi:predicted DNA repair protein MutK